MGPRRAIGGPQTPGWTRRGLGSSPRLSPSRPRGKAGVGESCAAWDGERRRSWEGWWRRRLGVAKAAPPARRGSRILHPLGPARTRKRMHMHSRTRGARMCTNAHAHAHTNLFAALALCACACLVTGGCHGRPHRCRAVCPPPPPARTAAPLGQVPRFYADPGLGPKLDVCVHACVRACVRACLRACVRTCKVVRSRTVQGCWSCCCRRYLHHSIYVQPPVPAAFHHLT